MPAHLGVVPGCVPIRSQRRVLAVETVCPAKPRTLIDADPTLVPAHQTALGCQNGPSVWKQARVAHAAISA